MYSVPVFAADALDDVVVSANRTATPMKQTGSSVTVITAEEIEKSQAVTAKELISRVPGVTVSDNGGFGKTSYVFIRGSSYSHIKIMVDGIQIDDLTHLVAADIERIEVLKGNQSTLYGSDAIGGVISITTKTGRDSQKLIEGSAFAEFGSQNTYKTGGNIRGRINKAYYNIGLTQYDTDGINISENTSSQSENDGYENLSVDARLGVDLLKDAGAVDLLNVEYLMRWVDSEVEFDNSGTQDGFNVAKDNRRHYKLQVKADLFDGLLKNEVSAAYSTSSTDSFDAGTRLSYDENEKNRVAKYEYKGVLNPVENHTLVFGADYQRLSIDNGDFHESQQGFFGNYQLELLDKALTLTAGARYDKVDSVDGELSYRATVGYYVEGTGTRFHGSYGTGFNTATAFQRQGGFNALKPEKARGYDLGVEQSLWDDRVILDVTAFNTRVQDEIVYQEYNIGAGKYVYGNIASTRTFGLETSLTAEVSNEVSLVGSYTYQEAKDIGNDRSLSLRPSHSGSAQINYAPEAVKGLSSWLRTTYQGSNWDQSGSRKDYIGGFLVHDIGANYEWDHGISFYGRVENLLDKHYEVKSDYAASGISGFVGARVKF